MAEMFDLSIFIIAFYREETTVTPHKGGKYATSKNRHYDCYELMLKKHLIKHTYAVHQHCKLTSASC